MEQEAGYLWTPIGGQTGTGASITAFSGGLATVTGLTGMTEASVLHVLSLGAAAAPGNIGTFQIVQQVSSSSVIVANANGSAPDANNGSITWTESTLDLAFPETVGVPDDGDAWDAAEFAPGYLGLLQRTAYLSYGALKVMSATFYSNGSWTCPPGCEWVYIVACGGGGGGDFSCVASTVDGYQTAQGAGGAGAPLGTTVFATVPGHVYSVVVGDGGGGGDHVAVTAGGDGAASFIQDTAVSANLWLTFGGSGCGNGIDIFTEFGYAVQSGGAGNPCIMIAPGARGLGVDGSRDWPWIDPTYALMKIYPNSDSAVIMDNTRYVDLSPGSGGACIAAHTITTSLSNFPQGASLPGQPCSTEYGGIYDGGSPGNQGAPAGSHLGGVGGGGGGGGPFGAGGNGGNGGAASASGTGSAGDPGISALANTGAGGGGAGNPGAGAASGPANDGGGGGSGIFILYWLQSTTPTSSITTP
jgi:hypothetical protein